MNRLMLIVKSAVELPGLEHNRLWKLMIDLYHLNFLGRSDLLNCAVMTSLLITIAQRRTFGKMDDQWRTPEDLGAQARTCDHLVVMRLADVRLHKDHELYPSTNKSYRRRK